MVRATRKWAGAKAGISGQSTGSSTQTASPTRKSLALTRPTTSPGQASSTVSRSWPVTDWAYFVANGLPVGPWVTTMPRSKRPEQTRTNATRSRWVLSMLAWTLKTRPENGRFERPGVAVAVLLRAGRRDEVDHGVEDQAHAEVGQRRAEEHRRQLAGLESFLVELAADGVEQLDALRAPRSTESPSSSAARAAGTISSGASVAPRAVRV